MEVRIPDQIPIQARIYVLKVDNGNNRPLSEICLKLTIKTPE